MQMNNVNVNVNVYSLISPSVQQTSQFTPLVLKLCHIKSHLLWGELSTVHCAAAIANHWNLAFSFHQILITAGWPEAE